MRPRPLFIPCLRQDGGDPPLRNCPDERIAVYGFGGKDFDPPFTNLRIKTAKRIDSRTSDRLPCADVETRAMLRANDISADLPPAFEREIEMSAAVFQGMDFRVDAEDQDGPAIDRKRAMPAAGNVLQGANIDIMVRHILGAPAL